MDGSSYGRVGGIVGSWVMDDNLERHGASRCSTNKPDPSNGENDGETPLNDSDVRKNLNKNLL